VRNGVNVHGHPFDDDIPGAKVNFGFLAAESQAS